LDKIRTGVLGLDPLLDGGLNRNSTTAVIGTAGAGKTTIATQFIRWGVESGGEGIYITLDENKEQIIQEAQEMGWSGIVKAIEDERLVFIDASGKDFQTFIKKELPSFVSDWKGSDARIAIDPLTPVMWSVNERYDQREMISFLMKETRKLGTVVCTLEEHGFIGGLRGPESVIPMFIADTVVYLRYSGFTKVTNRELRIIKCRSSRHSRAAHPYKIIRGLGLVVSHDEPAERSDKIPRELRKELEKLQDKIDPAAYHRFVEVIDGLTDNDFDKLDTQQIIQDILRDYSKGD